MINVVEIYGASIQYIKEYYPELLTEITLNDIVELVGLFPINYDNPIKAIERYIQFYKTSNKDVALEQIEYMFKIIYESKEGLK